MRDDEKMEEMQDMFSDILSEAGSTEVEGIVESEESVEESPIIAEASEEVTEVLTVDSEEADSKKKKGKKKEKKSKNFLRECIKNNMII